MTNITRTYKHKSPPFFSGHGGLFFKPPAHIRGIVGAKIEGRGQITSKEIDKRIKEAEKDIALEKKYHGLVLSQPSFIQQPNLAPQVELGEIDLHQAIEEPVNEEKESEKRIEDFNSYVAKKLNEYKRTLNIKKKNDKLLSENINKYINGMKGVLKSKIIPFEKMKKLFQQQTGRDLLSLINVNPVYIDEKIIIKYKGSEIPQSKLLDAGFKSEQEIITRVQGLNKWKGVQNSKDAYKYYEKYQVLIGSNTKPQGLNSCLPYDLVTKGDYIGEVKNAVADVWKVTLENGKITETNCSIKTEAEGFKFQVAKIEGSLSFTPLFKMKGKKIFYSNMKLGLYKKPNGVIYESVLNEDGGKYLDEDNFKEIICYFFLMTNGKRTLYTYKLLDDVDTSEKGDNIKKMFTLHKLDNNYYTLKVKDIYKIPNLVSLLNDYEDLDLSDKEIMDELKNDINKFKKSPYFYIPPNRLKIYNNI